MTDNPKSWRPAGEEPGVGMLDDGKLNIIPADQYKQWRAQRDAEEMLDMLDSTEGDEVDQ